MTATLTGPLLEARSDVRGAPRGETILRLQGPTIHAACVALQQLDSGLALATTFPRMRLPPLHEGDGPGPTIKIAAGNGIVRIVIEAATDALSAESLSRSLGCGLLLTRQISATRTRHAALFDRGNTIWEEQARSAAGPGVYRLSCPPLGILLAAALDDAEDDAVLAAWRQIHAYVDLALGPEAARVLARDDLADG